MVLLDEARGRVTAEVLSFLTAPIRRTLEAEIRVCAQPPKPPP
jgi:hypothetical protein